MNISKGNNYPINATISAHYKLIENEEKQLTRLSIQLCDHYTIQIKMV